MNKRLITIIASFVLILALTLAVTCSLVACDNEPPEPPVNLGLSATNVSLTLGETNKIYGLVDGKEVPCTFTSADERVAKVLQDGTIVARYEGSTTITANYGKSVAQCNVSVNVGDNVPVFELNASYDGTVQVDMLNGVDMTGKVYFNDDVFADDITYSYQVSDPTVGSVENGVFYPKNTGVCTVDVSAEWLGQVCSASVQVTVINSIVVKVNDNPVIEEVQLYAIPQFDGVSYQTEVDFSAMVSYDGEPLQTQVTILDEQVAQYSEGKIYGKNGGETVAIISATVGERLFERRVPVVITAPIANYSVKIVDFSALDGDLFDENGVEVLATEFGEDNPLWYASEQGKQLDLSTGKVLGVTTVRDGLTSTSITVCGKKYGYNFQVEGYTKILSKPEDILCLNLTSGSVINGYYLLKNDIDLTGRNDILGSYNTANWDVIAASWFGGVFDGNGKKIVGYKMGLNGFFGRLDGALVKDLSFVDATVPTGNGVNRALLFARVCGFTMPTQIQNCYVSINFDANTIKAEHGIFGERNSKNISVTNFILQQNMTATTTTSVGNTDHGNGLFTLDDTSRGWANFTNCYVIAPDNDFGRIMTLYQSGNYTIYAKNDVTDIVDGTAVAITVSNQRNPSVSEDPKNNKRLLYHYNFYRYSDVQSLVQSGVTKVGNFDLSSGSVVFSK